MLGMGGSEVFIIIAVVVLIFGIPKLPALGSGLGKAISGFKKEIVGMREPIEEVKETVRDLKRDLRP